MLLTSLAWQQNAMIGDSESAFKAVVDVSDMLGKAN